MKNLPMNDKELNRVVFKGANVYEPRSINDYFDISQINLMLKNGEFSLHTRDWLYHALDYELTKLGY